VRNFHSCFDVGGAFGAHYCRYRRSGESRIVACVGEHLFDARQHFGAELSMQKGEGALMANATSATGQCDLPSATTGATASEWLPSKVKWGNAWFGNDTLILPKQIPLS
jgi:hypothetical protein